MEVQKPYKRKKKRKQRCDAVKRAFNETRVGFVLEHEAPVEYKMILEAMKNPTADFIEAIAYSSNNPLFRKTKFWKALRVFRERGFYPRHPAKSSASIELYYIKIRACVK